MDERTPKRLAFDQYILDPVARSVFGPSDLDGGGHGKSIDKINLGGRAFDVLHYLMRARGKVVSPKELLKEIWRTTHVDEDCVVQAVGQIRSALGKEIIATTTRRGYSFTRPVKEIDYATENGITDYPSTRRNGTTNSEHSSNVDDDTRPIQRLLQDVGVKDCLRALGVSPQNLDGASNLISEMIIGRSTAQRDLPLPTFLEDFLVQRQEGREVVSAVKGLFVELFCCTDLSWFLGESCYLSVTKVDQMYRAHRSIITSEQQTPASDDTATEDQMSRLHRHFLRTRQIVFLPSRLLLGQPLPIFPSNCLFYFLGPFLLVRGEAFHTAFPEVREFLTSAKPGAKYISFPCSLLENQDPTLFPLVEFKGMLGTDMVSMVLSRKHLRGTNSSVGSDFALAEFGKPVVLSGLARLHSRSDGRYELHALACRFSSSRALLRKMSGRDDKAAIENPT